MDTHNKASKLVMHLDGGSNVCLVTTYDVLHKVVPHAGEAICTGEINEKSLLMVISFTLCSRFMDVSGNNDQVLCDAH